MSVQEQAESFLDSLFDKGGRLWDMYTDYQLERRSLDYEMQLAARRNELLYYGAPTQSLPGGAEAPRQVWSDPDALGGGSLWLILGLAGGAALLFFLARR